MAHFVYTPKVNVFQKLNLNNGRTVHVSSVCLHAKNQLFWKKIETFLEALKILASSLVWKS